MRVRLRFAKLGKVRFTSHRDVARIWERAFRRAGLGVAMTGGFRPRPKLSFGLALSTGHESLAEYLDVELAEPLDVGPLGGAGATEPLGLGGGGDLGVRLSNELPVGIDVQAVAVLEPGGDSLQEAVRSCRWRIEALGVDPARARNLVEVALAADELVISRQRKGREVTDDLRPAVLSVAVVGATAGGTELEAELAVHPRSVRPFELLAAVAPATTEGRVLRTAQLMWSGAGKREPLHAAVNLDVWRATLAEPCTIGRDSRDEPTSTQRIKAEPVGARAQPRRDAVPAGGSPGRP